MLPKKKRGGYGIRPYYLVTSKSLVYPLRTVILEHRRPRFFVSLLFIEKSQNDNGLRCEGSCGR